MVAQLTCDDPELLARRPGDVAAGLARRRRSGEPALRPLERWADHRRRCACGPESASRGRPAEAGIGGSPPHRAQRSRARVRACRRGRGPGAVGSSSPGARTRASRRSWPSSSGSGRHMSRTSTPWSIVGGMMLPFAKPLSIRTGRGDPLGQLVDVPSERVARHPVRAGLIVLTAYAPGARWRPSVRSRGRGSARASPEHGLGPTASESRSARDVSGLARDARRSSPGGVARPATPLGHSSRSPCFTREIAIRCARERAKAGWPHRGAADRNWLDGEVLVYDLTGDTASAPERDGGAGLAQLRRAANGGRAGGAGRGEAGRAGRPGRRADGARQSEPTTV